MTKKIDGIIPYAVVNSVFGQTTSKLMQELEFGDELISCSPGWSCEWSQDYVKQLSREEAGGLETRHGKCCWLLLFLPFVAYLV